jgi:hypothetical protein
MKIENGYFFISDITGYTQFLVHSELDHAKEILDALFDSILDRIQSPLVVSGTQGDAIICYAPDAAFHQPAQLLDVMERIYYSFRRLLEFMKLNTTCNCDACVNMSTLDLKIFLHHGQYLVQQIGTQSDLQGRDVILAHLLMKNRVFEKLGLRGYGLVTERALQAMGIDPVAEGMSAHVEQYEHYGTVNVHIHNLPAAWQRERERNRTVVTAEEATSYAGAFVPVPPWIAWDYASNMDMKKLFYDLESIERTDAEGGREKIGTSFHCHHKMGDISYVYVDYQPPDYVTYKGSGFGVTSLVTVRIAPAEGGSRFEIYNGPHYEPAGDETVALQQRYSEQSVSLFAKLILEEIQAGHIDLDQAQAETATKRGVGQPDVAQGGGLLKKKYSK